MKTMFATSASLLALTFALGAMACGGKTQPATPSNEAATTPAPAEATDGSAAGSAEAPKTCVDLAGTCTSKMAAVSCKAWHDTSDCSQPNEGCCVMQ